MISSSNSGFRRWTLFLDVIQICVTFLFFLRLSIYALRGKSFPWSLAWTDGPKFCAVFVSCSELYPTWSLTLQLIWYEWFAWGFKRCSNFFSCFKGIENHGYLCKRIFRINSDLTFSFLFQDFKNEVLTFLWSLTQHEVRMTAVTVICSSNKCTRRCSAQCEMIFDDNWT